MSTEGIYATAAGREPISDAGREPSFRSTSLPNLAVSMKQPVNCAYLLVVILELVLAGVVSPTCRAAPCLVPFCCARISQ